MTTKPVQDWEPTRAETFRGKARDLLTRGEQDVELGPDGDDDDTDETEPVQDPDAPPPDPNPEPDAPDVA